MLYRKIISYAFIFIVVIYVRGETTDTCAMHLSITIGSRCYWPLIIMVANFTESHRECQKQDRILTEIPDNVTLDIVQKNFHHFTPFWIGIHDQYSEGHFINMLNETSWINDWGIGKREFPDTDCVAVTSEWGLRDALCSAKFYPICSRKINSYLITTTAAKYDTLQAKENLTTSQVKTQSNQTTIQGARCLCPCNAMKNRLIVADDILLKMKIEAIKKELVIYKTSLSGSIRRRTSAKDLRKSSVAIGCVLGVIVIVIIIAFLVASDVYQLYRYLRYGLCRCRSEKKKEKKEEI